MALESYKLIQPASDKARETGAMLRRYSAERGVTMGDIAREIGCSILDVSDVFLGVHEVSTELKHRYRDAVDAVVEDRGEADDDSHL